MNFNGSLVRRTAQAMKSRGLMAAGYRLLSVGGSTFPHPVADEKPPWNNLIVRNASGYVQIDAARFPGPGSNMTMCLDETLLKRCLGGGATQRQPEDCGCRNGNAGMRQLIEDLHSEGFLWGSYSNEAGCQVAACNTTELNASKFEGFVKEDRALYIDDWKSDYLMIDSVGQTIPKEITDHTAWNKASLGRSTAFTTALGLGRAMGLMLVQSCR